MANVKHNERFHAVLHPGAPPAWLLSAWRGLDLIAAPAGVALGVAGRDSGNCDFNDKVDARGAAPVFAVQAAAPFTQASA